MRYAWAAIIISATVASIEYPADAVALVSWGIVLGMAGGIAWLKVFP